jgi:2-dehydropantoate 2-reductase
MDIAVLGAGGIGGYYGGLLARSANRVRILARGEHLDAIRACGLEIRVPDDHFIASVTATDDPQALLGAELAILAVKSYSLREIVPTVRLLAEHGSVVVPLLNGVETVEQLVELGVPSAQVLGGLTSISVAKVAPGVIERRSPFQRLVVGEPAGGRSERAEKVAATFAAAGADAHVSTDITADLWRKFAFITTLAAVCGLSRAPIGPVRNAPHSQLLLERAVREIIAVGMARGVALSEADVQQTLATLNGLGPQMKPSFLLDLERGGPSELDILSGAVARMGRECGVATPLHDTATTAFAAAVAR